MSKISMAKGGFQKWLAVTVAQSGRTEQDSKFDTLISHPDWDCNNIDLKIYLNGIEFDNLDNLDSIIQRVNDSLNEKDSLKERVEQLENMIHQLLYTSSPVATCVYNVAQGREDWSSIYENISSLDRVRNEAFKLLRQE